MPELLFLIPAAGVAFMVIMWRRVSRFNRRVGEEYERDRRAINEAFAAEAKERRRKRWLG